MPRRQDQLTFLSTHAESTYGTAIAAANMNRRFNVGSDFPEDGASIDILNVCGGRHPTGGQVLTVDRRFNFNGRCYPEAMAWAAGYAFGAYSVTGSGDPYTHKAVPLTAGDYALDSFTAYKAYDAAGVYFQYKGCQFDQFSITGAADGGNAALTWTGTGLTDGTRTEITSYTEATCDPSEACYRFADVTPSFGAYGGSSVSGITSVFRGFALQVQNAIQNDPRRTGTTVAAARENGEEVYTGTLTFQGSPSDAIDDLWQATLSGVPGYVFLTLTCANQIANRPMVLTGRKALITGLRPVFVGSNAAHGHEVALRFVQDYTDSTSKAESPLNMTVQGATATYRA